MGEYGSIIVLMTHRVRKKSAGVCLAVPELRNYPINPGPRDSYTIS